MSTPGVDTFPVVATDTTAGNSTTTTTPPFTPPANDALDESYVEYLFYDPATGAVKGGCQGHKYQCDSMATTMSNLGWHYLVGVIGTDRTHTVNVSGTPTAVLLTPFLTNNSWNKGSTQLAANDGIPGDPTTWDTVYMHANGTDLATLGSNLPASINVFIRFPSATGMLPASYTFPTTAGAWSFSCTTPGDYFFTFSATGYQDYNVHLIAS